MTAFKVLGCLFLASMIALPISLHADEGFKIGKVNMNEVFTAYHKRVEIEKLLRSERGKAKQEFDRMAAVYKQQMEKFEEATSALRAGELTGDAYREAERAAKEIGTKGKELEKELAEFKTRREQALKDQEVRMREGVLAEIMEVVNSHAEEQGFDYVFDSSGLSTNGIPMILYSKDSVDLTGEVIAVLNESAPAVEN